MKAERQYQLIFDGPVVLFLSTVASDWWIMMKVAL